MRGREENVRSERGQGRVSKPVCVTWRCGLSLWCGGSRRVHQMCEGEGGACYLFLDPVGRVPACHTRQMSQESLTLLRKYLKEVQPVTGKDVEWGKPGSPSPSAGPSASGPPFLPCAQLHIPSAFVSWTPRLSVTTVVFVCTISTRRGMP